MASKRSASMALFLALNILFFSLVSATCRSCSSSGSNPTPTPLHLHEVVNVTVGSPPVMPCCSLLNGLVDLEAAACLCTAIRANVLGLNLNIPVSLSLLLNVCSRNVPTGFQC
ncbi:hypothetical protein GOBAR_DD15334 [Gossypium barbadense]|nr:hypothetical protein GOBAR_DD15334 [Gossypium barbadense]